MKIALAQINYHIGNFESNISKIIDAIVEAKQLNVDLIVFAELAVSGYPPRDFLEFDDFITRCENAIQKIAESCIDIAAIVGGPSRNPSTNGKRLFNSAFFLSDGKIAKVINKALLPTYDIFDEYRYFEPSKDFSSVSYMGVKIALTICEDIWVEDENLYTTIPMDLLAKEEPDIMVNIAASPFHYDQRNIRRKVLTHNAQKYNMPLFYVNHVGAQTELLFDGGSMVLSSRGEVLDELTYFEEGMRCYELELETKNITACEKGNQKDTHCDESKISLIHDGLVMGVKNYFAKLGFEKAIMGLSGGIDSAVTFAIAAEALGPENVLGVLMPSRYSSDHSVKDALDLAMNLGSPTKTISIEEAFGLFEDILKPQWKGMKEDITEENIQARIRAVILMALSNKLGYILLNTSNKSEAAVGYGTLYGDMCGGLSVLGDVYKTEVFDLARYINRNREIIPENTIVKPPSAELRFDQKDSDSLPEYEILDKILYLYIELRKGPAEIIAEGYEKNLVDRVLRLVNTNEYKRYQTPPTLRVSPKAFGMGRRMPIVARYLS